MAKATTNTSTPEAGNDVAAIASLRRELESELGRARSATDAALKRLSDGKPDDPAVDALRDLGKTVQVKEGDIIVYYANIRGVSGLGGWKKAAESDNLGPVKTVMAKALEHFSYNENVGAPYHRMHGGPLFRVIRRWYKARGAFPGGDLPIVQGPIEVVPPGQMAARADAMPVAQPMPAGVQTSEVAQIA